MMKHKRAVLGLTVVAMMAMLTLTGCSNTKKTKITTFAEFTDCENFQDVPAMITENSQMGDAVDYGDDVWIICMDETTLAEYQAYLSTVEQAGFAKHVDNGETGLDDAVYTTTFTKDNKILTVTHVVKQSKTYIAAGVDLELSENLFYTEEAIADNKEGAKTSLHLLEMHASGASFVIQLKDGHFIVLDGGMAGDAPYLLDYLESLTPEGEKPVVDAWVISHAHHDHMGAMKAIANSKEYLDRLYVEAVYYNAPSDEAWLYMDGGTENATMRLIPYVFKTTEGKPTQYYRPQMGQRYYFNDVTMDVVYTQEQLLIESACNSNDASTWCIFTIEGQKFLFAGDADLASIDVVMSTYDSDYFNLDVFAVFHHGLNVYDVFTDFCTYKTVLYTSYLTGSVEAGDPVYSREAENQHLRESCLEYMAHGDGVKVLTFPYEVGTAECKEPWEWIYGERGNYLRSVN